MSLCVIKSFFKIYYLTVKPTPLSFIGISNSDYFLNITSLTVSTCPIEYSPERTKEVPYQNARAYDAQISRKAAPIEMLAVIAFFIPILLASSKFLLYLGEVTQIITHTHKSYETGRYNMMLNENLKMCPALWQVFYTYFLLLSIH